jgi:hypothetical protein
METGNVEALLSSGATVPPAFTDGLRVSETQDGHLDTQVRTSSGAWVRVHSLHAPEAEASRLVDYALNGQSVPPIVGVLGIGLGYVIDELERRCPDVRIVALELVPGLVESWRRRRDWSQSIRGGRLVVGVDPHYELPTPGWPMEALAEAPLVVVHPVLGRHLPLAVERARKAFAQFLFEQRANAEARRRLSGLYLRHTLENLPALAVASDVSTLDGLAADTPLVLCGAGPSLDRQLPRLRAYRDRAWLVALDTALRPLLAGGVVPDLVVSVDPTRLNGRHLVNLPTRARPWLVAEASLDPRALAAFGGRTFICRIGRAEPWPWLEGLGMAPSRLRVWGSVLTAGCDLISRMRGSPIVFAGMDLGFTDGQPYCRGTAFEEDWLAQQLRDGSPSLEAVWDMRIAENAMEEVGVDGRPTRTASHLIGFRNWVRAFVASTPEREFINATGAGILHGPGIVQADLTDVLGTLATREAAERVLRAAARPSFADQAPRLRSEVEAVVNGRSGRGVWRTWGDAVPEFDEAGARQQLRHAGRRLRSQEGARTMPMTESDWIDVPYDASNFIAKPPMQWSVSEPNVATYAYRVHGKTMTLAFKINHSTLDGQPANELCLRIPGNYLPARGMANPIWMCSHSGKECGYATVHPGLDLVVLFRATEEHFPIERGDFFVFGQLTFEVQ